MGRINNNTNKFRNPCFDEEHFSFSEKEENSIIEELRKLEEMLIKEGEAIFSISKSDNIYSGSLKIDTQNIFTHGKDYSANSLFNKLRSYIEKEIRIKNKALKINIADLIPLGANLKMGAK